MIIDFHTHVFAEKIVDRAVDVLCENAGNIKPVATPTVDGLLAHMAKYNADYAVAANIATKPQQQKIINDFAASINSGKIIAFGSVHPDSGDALYELERACDLGLKGIKLHPDYQDFFVDDKKYFALYEKCVKLGLIVLFHAGIDIGLNPPFHATPKRLAKIIPVFDGGVLVAAHYGGYMLWEEVLHNLCGKEIYFDTSYACGKMPVYLAKNLYNNHDITKFLFGTDFPWCDLGDELAFLRAILNDKDKFNLVSGANAKRILGI